MNNRATMFAVFCFVAAAVAAQNNIYVTAGVAQTVGAPTFVPGTRGTVVAVDTVTGIWWVNPNRLSGATWTKMGHSMREISGCTAPVGAPTKFQSWLVSNTCSTPGVYLWDGAAWDCLNCGSSGTVNTDATLDGDGSAGDPLKIAQQGASESQFLRWTGATWQPSWGNPYVFVTSGAAITAAANEVLVGTVSADVTFGLPSCNAANDGKRFKFVRNGTDAFAMTIDPSGGETFYDLSLTKTIYGDTSIDCTCRWNGTTGVWFYDKF